MKPQFVITSNVTVSSKDGSFNQSEEFKEIKVIPFEQCFQAKKATDGYPNCFIINLKNKISNINILCFTIADWCPIRKQLKLYDVDGYVTQMY